MSVSTEIKCDILPVINHYYVFLAGYYSVSPDSRGGETQKGISLCCTNVCVYSQRTKNPFWLFFPLRESVIQLVFLLGGNGTSHEAN